MTTSPYFDNDQEALLMGMFIGTLVSKGIECFPEVDDQGNYTDVVAVILHFEGMTHPVHLRWIPTGEEIPQG